MSGSNNGIANQVTHGLVTQYLQLKGVSHRYRSLTENQCFTNFSLLPPRRPSVVAQRNVATMTCVKPTVFGLPISCSLRIHGTQAIPYFHILPIRRRIWKARVEVTCRTAQNTRENPWLHHRGIIQKCSLHSISEMNCHWCVCSDPFLCNQVLASTSPEPATIPSWTMLLPSLVPSLVSSLVPSLLSSPTPRHWSHVF